LTNTVYENRQKVYIKNAAALHNGLWNINCIRLRPTLSW